MRFERHIDPKKSIGLGIEKRILPYLKAHVYWELRNATVLNEVFRKIEKELNIQLENRCPPGSNHYLIRVRIKGSNIIIDYEFDTPF